MNKQKPFCLADRLFRTLSYETNKHTHFSLDDQINDLMYESLYSRFQYIAYTITRLGHDYE